MSRDMVEDKKISEAVELLLKGGKMLGFHCMECDTPLFQVRDSIFCPHCKKKYKIVEKDGNRAVIQAGELPVQSATYIETGDSEKIIDNESLLEKVEKIFDKIAAKALNSDNIYEIKESVTLLKELAEILKILGKK